MSGVPTYRHAGGEWRRVFLLTEMPNHPPDQVLGKIITIARVSTRPPCILGTTVGTLNRSSSRSFV